MNTVKQADAMPAVAVEPATFVSVVGVGLVPSAESVSRLPFPRTWQRLSASEAISELPMAFMPQSGVSVYEEPRALDGLKKTCVQKRSQLLVDAHVSDATGSGGWWRVRCPDGQSGYIFDSTQGWFATLQAPSRTDGLARIPFLEGWLLFNYIVYGAITVVAVGVLANEIATAGTASDIIGALLLIGGIVALLIAKLASCAAAGRGRRWGVIGLVGLNVMATVGGVVWEAVLLERTASAMNLGGVIEAGIALAIVGSHWDKFR